MAEFIDTVDDAIDVTDDGDVVLFGVGVIEVILTDTVLVEDAAGALYEVALDDTVLVDDELIATRIRGIFISDTVSVTDELTSVSIKVGTVSDSIAVADSLQVTTTYEREPSDAVLVADLLVAAPTIVFHIASASALTPTRVRVEFEVPALINAALSRATSYRFDNLSPGAVDVTPLSVSLPAGQPTPLYVEIETTEHTNEGAYEVALTSAIRGAAGEIGSTDPVEYEGIGVAPTLQLVLAISSTEVQVHFSEAIANEPDANRPQNYAWDGGLHTVAVRSVIGNIVTLQTSQQIPGQLYNLTVTGSIAPNDRVLDDDPVDVEDELIVEFTTLNVIIDDSVEAEDDIAREIPPRALAMAIGIYTAPVVRSGVQSSQDGLVWSDEAFLPDHGMGAYHAAYGNGVNVIAASSATITSDGHGGWTINSIGGDSAYGLVFAPELGVFVMGGGNVFRVGPDGVNWPVVASADVPSGINYIWSICWSPELGLLVAGGTEPDMIQVSSDGGATWTRHTQGGGFTAGLWWGMAWSSGIGLFLAAGGNSAAPDNLQTSPDGITWTPRTPGGGFTGTWLGCAASPSMFVAIGYDGSPRVQSSPDGITWTPRTFDTPDPNFSVAYGITYRADLGLFILCGDGVEIQTSPDGITWTKRAPGGGIIDAVLRGVG